MIYLEPNSNSMLKTTFFSEVKKGNRARMTEMNGYELFKKGK